MTNRHLLNRPKQCTSVGSYVPAEYMEGPLGIVIVVNPEYGLACRAMFISWRQLRKSLARSDSKRPLKRSLRVYPLTPLVEARYYEKPRGIEIVVRVGCLMDERHATSTARISWFRLRESLARKDRT